MQTVTFLERVGFEPTMSLNNSFTDYHLKPLSHRAFSLFYTIIPSITLPISTPIQRDRRDLNSHLPVRQTGALPIKLQPPFLLSIYMGRMGFEPMVNFFTLI